MRAYEAFIQHDIESIKDTAAEDFVEHEAPEGFGTGLDVVERNLEMLIAAFPDVRFELLDVVAEERVGAARNG